MRHTDEMHPMVKEIISNAWATLQHAIQENGKDYQHPKVKKANKSLSRTTRSFKLRDIANVIAYPDGNKEDLDKIDVYMDVIGWGLNSEIQKDGSQGR